jgi:hypothetical protein
VDVASAAHRPILIGLECHPNRRSLVHSRRRRLCEQPLRLTVSVSWSHNWDLHFDRKQEHVVMDTQGNSHPRGVRVLGRVRKRLRDGVIGGDLDLVREARQPPSGWREDVVWAALDADLYAGRADNEGVVDGAQRALPIGMTK